MTFNFNNCVFLAKRPRIIWTLHEVMLNDVMLQYFDSPEILLQKESCQSFKKYTTSHSFRNLPGYFPPIRFSGIPEMSPNAQNPKHLCMIVLLCAKQCSNRISAQKVHQVRRLRWSRKTVRGSPGKDSNRLDGHVEERKSWLVHEDYKLTMKYITSNDSC